MSTKKNQKNYNKKVLALGKDAIKYWKSNLKLLNNYTTNYADRTDYWTSKLNNRQVDLLQDKYLAQNASMLRGQQAFGSNSSAKLSQEENAYEQQNYLANVANKNVELANQLQQNEINSLLSAGEAYYKPTVLGGQAAQNVDAINSSWLNTLGKGLSAVGSIGMGSGNPWAMAAGAASKAVGEGLASMSSDTVGLGEGLSSNISNYTSAAVNTYKQTDFYKNRNLSSTDSVSSPSTLSTFTGTNPSSLLGFNTNLGGTDSSSFKFSWQ